MSRPDASSDAQALKERLRRRLIVQRNRLDPAERLASGEAMARHLLRHERVRGASALMLYRTYRSEMPTDPLLAALAGASRRLALPHMTSGALAMVAAEYSPGDPLEPGPYGVLQPARLRIVPAETLDLIVAPGVGFDPSGGRIGYGKGCYDRFLSDPALRAWVVGAGFEIQLLDAVPAEPHDRRMDAVATERGIRTCG